MNEEFIFYPPKRFGIIFHFGFIIILTLAGAWGLWQAVHSSVGPAFLLSLLPFLVALPLIPFLVYRLNNLENASYTLERDSLRLRWGLRIESIPMTDIQWIRPATDLKGSLLLPRIRWPGAILGVRRLPGGVTNLEFMASQTRNLLVIATAKQLFAISPEDSNEFLRAYQHFTELGSLLSPPPRSIHPAMLVSRLWRTPLARNLILVGALLDLGVLVWVSLKIPQLEQVSLGFAGSGELRPPIPSIRLMLFPVLNSLVYLVNLFLGTAFFRREGTRPLAYLLWITSIFVSILFLAAIYFIL